jgi:hypothetical protein
MGELVLYRAGKEKWRGPVGITGNCANTTMQEEVLFDAFEVRGKDGRIMAADTCHARVVYPSTDLRVDWMGAGWILSE